MSTVNGPTSSTNNAIALWEGTAGDTIADSPVIVDDTGLLIGLYYTRVSFSTASQDTAMTSLCFSPDGLTMYVLGNVTNAVYWYSLSTAWDITTASYSSSFSVAGQDLTPHGMTFKPDGTKFYMVGRDNASGYEYDVATPWDLSTASYASLSVSLVSQDNTPTGIGFSPDGATMFVAGLQTGAIYQYTLSTPWDISTASYGSVSLDVSSQDPLPQDLIFKPDGTQLFIVGDGGGLYQYALSAPWDLSTAAYNGVAFDLTAQETEPQGLFFAPDGITLFIIGNISDAVFQYTSRTNSGDVVLAGEDYLSILNQVITAEPVDLSGSNVTGILASASFPELTGDVTTSAGSLATTIKTDVNLDGSPTTTTQSPGDNSTKIATTEYVDQAVSGVGGKPTFQYLKSGSSATYTTPANCKALHLEMVGGGGGGGATVTNGGSAGGDTVFNSVHASGGSGGTAGTTQWVNGGAGGTGGSGTAQLRIPGGSGGGTVSGAQGSGGFGGGTRLSGPVGINRATQAGSSAAANTGCGGQGGSSSGSDNGAGGGGGGEYVVLDISSPASSYTYTVGGGGNGGAAGTLAGGNGGSGLIIVTEYY